MISRWEQCVTWDEGRLWKEIEVEEILEDRKMAQHGCQTTHMKWKHHRKKKTEVRVVKPWQSNSSDTIPLISKFYATEVYKEYEVQKTQLIYFKSQVIHTRCMAFQKCKIWLQI
jgi:hypothetical protein